MTNPFAGNWAYRSFLNDADLSKAANDLLFGAGTLTIAEESTTELSGTIGGPGWSLELRGSFGYGAPMQVRFQGKGVVGGEQWIYDYIGWLVPVWPNSTDQLEVPAIVGSVIRTIPHSGAGGGTNPAGVVASFYAARAD
ncbi:hypothetical protein MesoLjLc_25120 [Mesorhizobium sp. L-8-10]|uniref:hypothetical protein n=1 Tax=Mesorhizobium sp. L-8-10 TaxID=2744523 RepID=UPI00192676B9|nr:hypothetical protein [Mesorhizobium sp. L-8-10]BCH30582.1 hypothetical protein MesoLjLc_25120 [Mesorhizobium sp. L-8-10]